MRSQFPKLREEFAIACLPKIRRAFAAARAGLAADHSFDHIDVPQPPHRKHLIVFDQTLRQQEERVMLLRILINPHKLADPTLSDGFTRFIFDTWRRGSVRKSDPAPFEKPIESMGERGLRKPGFKYRALFGTRLA